MDSNRLVFTPSIAGVWQFVDDSKVTPSYGGNLGNSSFSNVRLGADQSTGVVMIGWGYNGFDNTATEVTPVNLGILEQQPDGTLQLKTTSYVASPQTNGTHSIIVADFNGDGRDDIFLPAHNESPFLLTPSTLLLSNSAGGFDKQVLTDGLMAHDAQLGVYEGEPVIVTAGYSQTGKPASSPTYRWDENGAFSWDEGATRNASGAIGSSVQLADFDGDGTEELLVGDYLWGPGYPYTPQNHNRIAIFRFDGTDIVGEPEAMFVPWVEANYPTVPSTMGVGNAHIPRVWAEDFNYDGRTDIIAEVTLWNHGNNTWPLMLQMLQNDGGFDFTDVTDSLNPDFEPFQDLLDYEFQSIDLDGSGVRSYLSGHAAPREFDGEHFVGIDARQSNWLLVNDGTGRMHVALHDEYVEMGRQVLEYAASLYHDPQGLFVETGQGTPRLHGYLTDDGLLNFVAEVNAFSMRGGFNHSNQTILVNVPVEIDIREAITDAFVIEDRNGSGLMRTFAGNDTIHDTGAGPTASIDGGLGIDTAVYSHASGTYAIAKSGAGISVSGNGLADTLHDIERLQFTDKRIAMDLGGHAGMVAKIIGAVFGPDALENETYASIGLQLADGGMDFESLMGLALGARLGGAPTNAQVVELLYANVIGVAPSAGERDSYVALLDSQQFTPASLGVMAAQTSYNAARIDLVGLAQTGIEYI